MQRISAEGGMKLSKNKSTVAVDQDLTNVKQHLENAGYDVVAMSRRDKTIDPSAEAIVLSGLSENPMGREEVLTSVPVVDADGLSPSQVLERLNRHVSP